MNVHDCVNESNDHEDSSLSLNIAGSQRLETLAEGSEHLLPSHGWAAFLSPFSFVHSISEVSSCLLLRMLHSCVCDFNGWFCGLNFRSLQIRIGAMEEETVGCDAFPAAGSLLGIPPASVHRPRHQADAPRQSSAPWLQGKAGYDPLAIPAIFALYQDFNAFFLLLFYVFSWAWVMDLVVACSFP